LLGFLDAGQLTADLVVADEFDANLTVGAFFQIAGKLKPGSPRARSAGFAG
jgi:hypothetical protein